MFWAPRRRADHHYDMPVDDEITSGLLQSLGLHPYTPYISGRCGMPRTHCGGRVGTRQFALPQPLHARRPERCPGSPEPLGRPGQKSFHMRRRTGCSPRTLRHEHWDLEAVQY